MTRMVIHVYGICICFLLYYWCLVTGVDEGGLLNAMGGGFGVGVMLA